MGGYSTKFCTVSQHALQATHFPLEPLWTTRKNGGISCFILTAPNCSEGEGERPLALCMLRCHAKLNAMTPSSYATTHRKSSQHVTKCDKFVCYSNLISFIYTLQIKWVRKIRAINKKDDFKWFRSCIFLDFFLVLLRISNHFTI